MHQRLIESIINHSRNGKTRIYWKYIYGKSTKYVHFTNIVQLLICKNELSVYDVLYYFILLTLIIIYILDNIKTALFVNNQITKTQFKTLKVSPQDMKFCFFTKNH